MTFKINKSKIRKYGKNYIINNICKNFDAKKTTKLIPNIEISITENFIVLHLSTDNFSLFGNNTEYITINI